MKKQIFLFLLLLGSINVFAQEVVSTQGDSYSNSNGSVDFTIGEVIINTESIESVNLTQGFHQSNLSVVGLEDHDSNYEVIIFPNPTEDILNIKTSMFKNVSFVLYDALGKVVSQNKLSAEQTTIELSHLAAGSYSLRLKKKNKHLKTFNLIKIK